MMTKKNNRYKYLRDLKHLMPVYGKEQRIYLNTIDQSLDDYCNSNPDASYEELVENFGSPQEIIGDYLREQDTHTLIKQINRRRILHLNAIVFLAALCLCSIVFCYYCYRSYVRVQQICPVYTTEEIIITDYSTEE
jgi:uncharacterized membrane protein